MYISIIVVSDWIRSKFLANMLFAWVQIYYRYLK